jgi:hypothetical protein
MKVTLLSCGNQNKCTSCARPDHEPCTVMTMMKTSLIVLDSVHTDLESLLQEMCVAVEVQMAYPPNHKVPVHDFLTIKEMAFEDKSKWLVGIMIRLGGKVER